MSRPPLATGPEIGIIGGHYSVDRYKVSPGGHLCRCAEYSYLNIPSTGRAQEDSRQRSDACPYLLRSRAAENGRAVSDRAPSTLALPPPTPVAKGESRYTLSRNHPPTAEIAPGERIVVETELNIGDHLRHAGDQFDISMVAPPFLNGATGPIFVRGASSAHVLVCEIEEMELIPPGFTALAPGLWPFAEQVAFPPPGGVANRVVDVRDGHIVWDERTRIPIRPMVGVLGTAPGLEAISTMDCGPHGGNLDVQEFAPGTRVFLPVAVDGALLFVGDCHAVQGDGELAGFGAIEIRSRVTMRVDLAARPTSMRWPRFDDGEHIGVVASGRPLEDAFRLAVRELATWLADDYGYSLADAVLLLGQVARARCTQLVNPHFTYVCKIEKRYLDGPAMMGAVDDAADS
jgi:amidase